MLFSISELSIDNTFPYSGETISLILTGVFCHWLLLYWHCLQIIERVSNCVCTGFWKPVVVLKLHN